MTGQALRFAANLRWLYPDTPLDQAIEAAAAEGFRGVEIPAPYSSRAKHLRTVLDDTGLEAVLLNTPLGPAGTPTANGAACVPERGQEFRDGVERGLEYAQTLGCSLLHIVGGRRPADVSYERAFAQYVHNIGWAADLARGTGVRLVLEMQNQQTVPRFILESQAAAAAVVEAVGEPVRLLFDFFHTQVEEGDLVRTFDAMLPLIEHIQVGEAPERTEPGTGELSWSFLLDHVRRSGYSGWVGCEFSAHPGSAGVLSRLTEVAS